MLKISTILFIIFVLSLPAAAQKSKRYKDMVFAGFEVKYDGSYAADTVKAADKEAYEFDLYTPQGDAARNRPLVIWIHGGGFVFGTKADENMRLWCQTFARRGYVCAAINYRKGKKTEVFNFDKLVKNCYPAVLDARQAVKYFKQHAGELGINPARIILAGNSAGGIIALQAAFGSNREIADSLHIANPAAFGGYNDGPTRVAGVINFWGGIFNLSWLKSSPAVVVNVYGSKDKIVHPGYYKGNFGGQAIARHLTATKHAGCARVFEGYGHELYKHFNPLPIHFGKAGIRKRWLQSGQFAANCISSHVVY